MRKQVMLVLMIISMLALFSGCDVFTSMFGSSEAVILDYASDYIIGDPVIDIEARTLEVTVKPIDLSDFEPEITVSELAVLSVPDSIEDGVAAEYTVTAENGDAVTWTVTVTVAYGIRYLFDGTEVTLLYGFSDSRDTDDNEAWGEGVPGIEVDSVNEDCEGYIFEKEYDWGEQSSAPQWDYSELDVDKISTGYSYGSLSFNDYSEESSYQFTLNMNIEEFGSLGDDFIAVFDGEGVIVEDLRSVARAVAMQLTEGYAKLKIVERGSPGR